MLLNVSYLAVCTGTEMGGRRSSSWNMCVFRKIIIVLVVVFICLFIPCEAAAECESVEAFVGPVFVLDVSRVRSQTLFLFAPGVFFFLVCRRPVLVSLEVSCSQT